MGIILFRKRPEAIAAAWNPLLGPVLAGREAQFCDARLTEIFGPHEQDNPGKVTFDDCLGRRKACLVCITPRSGSTYLSTLLKSTKRLGVPSEFMNLEEVPEYPLGIHKMVREHGFRALHQYLRLVIEKTSSPKRIFSMKGDLYHYLPLLRRGLIRKGLRKLTFVYVTREDLLAQAVSAYRAIQSGQWSSLHRARGEVEYDAQGILEQLDAVLRMMAGWELVFAFLGVEPVRLTYEQIAANPTGVVQALASRLGVRVGPDIKSPLSQQRDELSAEWVERIRADASGYIARAGWTTAGGVVAPRLETGQNSAALSAGAPDVACGLAGA